MIQRLKSEGILTNEQSEFALRNNQNLLVFDLLPKLHKNGVRRYQDDTTGPPVVSSWYRRIVDTGRPRSIILSLYN